MLVTSVFLALFAVVSASPALFSTFTNNVIFNPPTGGSIIYPRHVELSDGTLLATGAYAPPSNPHQLPFFPIFASEDGGATWTLRGNMTDQVNGLGMVAQPALAELPFDVGEWPAGSVLASGNSWGPNSTNIDLYGSLDKGMTWKFISNVARGSAPSTQNGNPCIWEPFILAFNNTVGVFYSDQRDPLHGQKLAHQESVDLTEWGPVIDDVAFLNYTNRPGMTVITYIPPLSRWIFVHEFPGGDSFYGTGYPVNYRLSDSPFEFRFAFSYPIVADGVQPNASPYVVWSPVGGVNGSIIVSDADHQSVFVNRALGVPNQWEMHATPASDAYSRSMLVFKNHTDHLALFGASTYAAHKPFTVSVVNIQQTLGMPPGN